MIQATINFILNSTLAMTVLIIGATIFLYWLRKRLADVHKPLITQSDGKWTLMNFGQTQSWSPKDIFRPQNFEELINFLKEREKSGIKHVRAMGANHSWSRCAATSGVNVDITGLNRILDVDRDKRRIKAEAGIILGDLYKCMRANNMAFPAMPNIEIITLGGAVSNGTHGTSIKHGSFSSLVYGIELIDVTGKLWSLTRDSKDPKIQRYFDAALVSFGSLGIIYSITMEGVEDFNMFNVRSYTNFSNVKGKIAEIAKKYDSVQFLFQTDKCYLRSSTRVAPEGTYRVAVKKKRFSFFQEILKDVFWYFHSKQVFPKFCQWLWGMIYYEMSCVTWDQYEIFQHTKPFTNMEYALPENKIEEAVEFVQKKFSTGERERNLFWVIRPVGADERGFLSATRRDCGTPAFYIDIPYQNKGDEKEVKLFSEIEQGLLKLGGRCSFSRLFWNRSQSVLENFWDKGGVEWKKVKLELDPNHVFTNDFVNSIFFDNKIKLD
jgi:FAD/FMN-containing dehydrogenase